MDAAVAENVAHTTRDQAVHDARADLQELRRRAVEAGRDRSRRITKTSRIDPRTGEIRYNPAGRLLRDWYLHVYLNTLRANLGEPAEPIDAQQVEDTTALLHRVRPESQPLQALQAVGVLRDIAVDDAAQAAAEIVAHLNVVAARRAVLHAGDERFDGDQLRIHVTRHWYQRCYDNHVESATSTQRALSAVTDAEERQVAHSLGTREIRRLIGRDGIPLITLHNTLLNDVDRRLAAGETGVIPAATHPAQQTDGLTDLRERVIKTWTGLAPEEQRAWLGMVGGTEPGGNTRWSSLTDTDQGKAINYYLATHRIELLNQTFEQPLISAAPETAAQRMFNHQAVLVTGLTTPSGARTDPDGPIADQLDITHADDTTRTVSGRATGLGHS